MPIKKRSRTGKPANKILIVMAVLVAVVASGSCSSDSTSAGADELTGTWKTACYFGGLVFFQDTVAFDGATTTWSSEFSSFGADSTCAPAGGVLGTPAQSGTYVKFNNVTIDGLAATEIDLIVDTLDGAPFSFTLPGIYAIKSGGTILNIAVDNLGLTRPTTFGLTLDHILQ